MHEGAGEGAQHEPPSDQTDEGPKTGGEEALEGGEGAEGAEADKDGAEDPMGTQENQATFQQ